LNVRMRIAMNFFKSTNLEDELLNQIDKNRIPSHIAIIMDGNGRWAKKRNLPRTFGHRAAVENIKAIVKCCSKIGVKYLTLYAFSTENWKRPPEEVSTLMSLLVEYLKKEINELDSNNVFVNYIGDISALPEICQAELIKSKKRTINNKGLTLNLALNYGGRDEIKKAVVEISKEVKSGKLCEADITENLISNYLYTSGMPDPDLVIRTSGEYRISNFLLWQGAYSELWFSDIYWPDFKPKNLYEAIIDYQKRDRRFGGIK
jgi:undecaprenyl diphosphate synthase